MSAASITRLDGVLFKRSMLGARARLAAERDTVNQLNVFPVPDGDTGTNMLLTLESAIEEMGTEDITDLSRVAQLVAHGALMGARGNSGVILSQVLRGFAQGAADKVSVDCHQLAHAFTEATSVAYRGVTKPTEGTILTVARAASGAAQKAATETTDVGELMQRVVVAAQRAVDETPSQLAVLREAGVVDAGGYGLMVILDGFLRVVRGQEAAAPAPAAAAPAETPRKVGAHALELPEEGWGFCTEFLIDKPAVSFDEVREELTGLGESAVIVGDDALVRVHIHTHDPGNLIAHATRYGQLLKLKVEDMSRQHHDILEQAPATTAPPPAPSAAAPVLNGTKPAAAIGVVAVAKGDGFRRIFEELGAGVVEGGQTMNPSTEDLLQAVESVASPKVIILPNNKNVILSAQQVQGLSEKDVVVVPTNSIPQGISALLSLDPSGGLEDNTEAMEEALKAVDTIEVTKAVRSTSVNGIKIKTGDVIGVTNGKITAKGDTSVAVIRDAIRALNGKHHELLTLYAGEGVTDDEANEVAGELGEAFAGLTVEVQRGEQEHYPFIVSLE